MKGQNNIGEKEKGEIFQKNLPFSVPFRNTIQAFLNEFGFVFLFNEII